MADSQKRKRGPTNGPPAGVKRSKGGNKKQWQTTSGLAKSTAPVRGGSILPGDAGIWVTCMRGKEGKATIELNNLLPQYGEQIYSDKFQPTLKSDSDEKPIIDDAGAQVDDIEASIKAELEELETNKKDEQGQLIAQQFQPVFLDVPCVLFFKTQSPVDPVEFILKMCQDYAKNAANGVPSKTRFANRLAPSSLVGKANEKSLEDVGRKVLGKVFKLADNSDGGGVQDGQEFTYAIRPTIRNHNTLQRDAIIKQVAGLVDNKHKVNLGAPDKIILIEIYQNICGMSVIDGPSFEELKRYNLHEIYQDAAKKKEIKVEVKEEPSAESRAKAPASPPDDVEHAADAKEQPADVEEEPMDTA